MRRRAIPHGDAAPDRDARGVGWIDSRLDRKWSVPSEDLSREVTLLPCSRAEFAGAPRPRLGDYPILARIGQGGMGVVYFSVHPRLETEVAVKILPEEIYARQPELLRRFIREARLAARLTSDFLVRVLDVDRDPTSGLYYLVMEYVRGVSAGKWLEQNAASSDRGVDEDLALDVCIAATRGLAAAHERGTIHRDVKPDNILIPGGEAGFLPTAAKLADLGLACPDEKEPGETERLTGAKMMLMGTPGYAAPEQLKDPTRAKKPADVFSMGATLYALLARRGPFVRGSAVEAVVATMKNEMTPIKERRPDVTAGTAALLDVCLRPEPEKRYPDAFALLEALRLCRSSYGKTERRGPDVTTEVVRLSQRSEVGQAVRTDATGSAKPTTGRLRIEGGPPGAQITLRRRGVEPRSYAVALDADGRYEREHVEEGVYELAAARAGFHPYVTTVEIAPGDLNIVRLALRERDGIVSIDSDPQGAEVTVDGAPVGVTPLPGLAVLPGERVIAVSSAGYERFTKTISVRGGASTVLGTIKLEPLGRIDLTGQPDDVHFELAGKAVRGNFELTPGTHRLRASRDGYEPQIVEVVVAARATAGPVLGTWRRHGWSLVSHLERWDATTTADRRRVARAITEKLSDFGLRAMETFESGAARHEVAIFVHRPTGLEFVLVPGGSFAMGSDAAESGRRSDERRHPVNVGPFLMARTPVTQAAWEAASFPNASQFRGPSLPADHVSHDDAKRFCEATGLALPTEAQWEYACRAGFDGPWCFGVDATELAEYAWFAGNAGDGPRPVGGRRPNAFGLFDMHGNVREWCADRYAEYPFETEQLEPAVECAGDYRVFRGGGWLDPPERLRAAQRSAFRADYRSFDLGLRVVLTLTPDLVAEKPGADGARERSAATTWNRGATARVSIATPPEEDALAPLADLEKWDAASSAERRRAAEETAARDKDVALVSLTTFEAGGARHEIAVFLHAPTEMEFVLVPGGPFAPPGRGARPHTEVRAAVLLAPFLFARTQTTQAAWRRTMGGNPSSFLGDRLPVERVDLGEATAFCDRLGLALPTESQWEHACRAGTTAPWCCGDEKDLPDFAWFDKNAGRSTHPVGEKKPNAFGLFDVVGNVWEWCRPDEEGAREARIRGGAWTSDARQLDSSRRLSYAAGTRMGILGFRPLRAIASFQEARR